MGKTKQTNQEKPLSQLIGEVNKTLEERGYSKSSRRHYGCIYNVFKQFSQSEIYTDEEGARFLNERYGVVTKSKTPSRLTSQMQTAFRAMMILSDYHHGRAFTKRRCRKISKYVWADAPLKEFEEFFQTDRFYSWSKGYQGACLSEFKRLSVYLHDNQITAVAEITPAKLVQYLSTALAGYSSSKRCVTFSIFRTFFRFAYISEYHPLDLSESVPVVRRTPSGSSVDWADGAIEKLLSCMDRANPTEARDYAIILLISRLGLRISDVKNLRMKDIIWEENRIEIVQQKTDEPLVLPLLKDVGEAIIEYLKFHRPISSSNFVFLSHDKLLPLEFHGVFKEHLKSFVLEKRGLGLKYGNSFVFNLKHFDRFSLNYDCSSGLTKELAMAWTEKMPYHSRATQEGRISLIRQFALYLKRNGVAACILPICNSTEFYRTKPYIFTTDEISRIFSAADEIPRREWSPNRHLVMPLVFRILYCCGLRISEALKLQTQDVDLTRGTLDILDAKGNRNRIVPIDDQLRIRCAEYYGQVHKNSAPTDYFFPSPCGGYYDQSTVYRAFRQVLAKCGISHGGRGKGPRMHDLRHTFSVHSFRKFMDGGRDPMEILPILAAYLGHKTYAGTTHYLHLVSEVFPEITGAVEKIYGSLIPALGGDVNEAD